MNQDRNFDPLYKRFMANIKGSDKGLLRDTLIREDILTVDEGFKSGGKAVLDGGCGLGEFSVWAASLGHNVDAIDLSQKMTHHTAQALAGLNVTGAIDVQNISVQDHLRNGKRYDLICLHAVLEWLEDPLSILRPAAENLRQGGLLSVAVYNIHRTIFTCLTKGNFQRFKNNDFGGQDKGSLTPQNPLDPSVVVKALKKLGLVIELRAGLRCFYDYLPKDPTEQRSFEDILMMERRYRKKSPYRDMARYVHIVAKSPN